MGNLVVVEVGFLLVVGDVDDLGFTSTEESVGGNSYLGKCLLPDLILGVMDVRRRGLIIEYQ